MCLLFPFESNFLFPIKKMGFCKGFVRKNLCLVPRTSFCGCVTPLIWVRLFPAYIAVGSWMRVPSTSGNYSGNSPTCKHVLSSARVPVWNGCLQKVRRLTLLVVVGHLLGINSCWHWFCASCLHPLSTQSWAPCFAWRADWEQQLWAHFLEPVLDVEMGRGSSDPIEISE